MDKLLHKDYYLGPEFQQDSSIMRILAETLVLSHMQGVDDAFKTHLQLLLQEFAGAFTLMRHVQAKREIFSFNAVDDQIREDAAAEFREKCFLVENIHEHVADFVAYCSDKIELNL